MGWFDEQIRLRKQKDQDVFEESILQMASVVLGRKGASALGDERLVTKAAIDEILKYYHYKPIEVPSSVKDMEDQIDYCLRPYGLMRRNVRLEPGWYKDAYGPMLAFRKENGLPTALLPHPFHGYYFYSDGKKCDVDRRTQDLFESDAICFYRPLPLRKLGIPDLLRYMADCLSAGDYVMLILLTLLVTLTQRLLPYINRILTGTVLKSANSALLVGTAGFLIATLIVSQLIGSVKSLSMKRLETKTSLSVEAALMMRLMSLPAGFFRQYSAGELSQRSQSVNSLCKLLLGNVFSMGLTSLMSLLYITEIFKFAPALVKPSLLIILCTLVISIITSLLQIRISREQMERSAKTAGISYALISGVQKIKLGGAEKRAFARWANSYGKEAQISYDPPLLIKLNEPIMTAVNLVGTIVIYFIAVQSSVAPSEYIAFSTAYGMVSAAFSALTSVTLSIAQIKPILDMAEPILKAEPEVSQNREILTNISGGIELNNVYFRYNEHMPYVVNGMSLKIKPGEYIAIVGKTGCGKSSLIRLLMGFETPEKGAIYYDGKDLNSLDLQSLRKKIGAVTQDGGLFQGDIFSNITISAPYLTLDEAWEAAEIAGIADDIRAMPMGMHTIIAEGQGGISGGQKQRLMIARAVAPKPKILIFDEATSALDNKTQKQVSEALDKLKCTRIVVAHRLSTIKHCDRILVLDQGVIQEDGTYDELIAKGGFFASLVERQRLDTGKNIE